MSIFSPGCLISRPEKLYCLQVDMSVYKLYGGAKKYAKENSLKQKEPLRYFLYGWDAILISRSFRGGESP